LGYDWKEVRKGLYKDGHEREDVVDYQQNTFLPQLEALKPRLLEWDENGDYVHTPAEILAATGESPCVLVTHDECTFHSNEGPTHQWVKTDSQPLRKKELGKGIMLSGFLTPLSTLQAPEYISDLQLQQLGLRRDAMEMIECGGNVWWDNEKLMQQINNYAIPIFELAFPGCQAVFLFDNAPSHHAWAKDALKASSMNLRPGGKAPDMRDGWYIGPNGNRVQQSFNFSLDDFTVPENWRGRPKGLKVILQERGLWYDKLKQKCKGVCNIRTPEGCCAERIMSIQSDFKEQTSKVQQLVADKGHLALLYPKFHCELNWIEYFWGAAKWYTRKNCTYTLSALRAHIPEDLCHAQKFVWRYWRKSRDIMEAYRAGTGWSSHTNKQYKSHRRVQMAGLLNPI
jgi:hypothetical protein